MSNFVNVPADLSCKLFDTLIRPILLYNILFEIRRTVGLSGQKITRTGNTAKYAGASVRQFFCVFCFAPEIGNATGMPERSQSTRN